MREHGFKPTDESDGITMFNQELEGTVAVHRLRLLDAHHAYLLASNPDEISRLADPTTPTTPVSGSRTKESSATSTNALNPARP